jgi:hypothetical protein
MKASIISTWGCRGYRPLWSSPERLFKYCTGAHVAYGEPMSKSDFDDFVKRQQAQQQDEAAAFNPKQQLDEWLSYLDALYKEITVYLQDYTKSGAAQIEYRDIPLNEEFIGPYTARQMILKIGSATVTFTPIGTMLIGTKGRVDVQGPLGTKRLNLVNKWMTSGRQLVQVTVRRSGDPPPAPASPEAVRQIEWAWKINTPPPEMKFIDLTDEVFFDLILAVANV